MWQINTFLFTVSTKFRFLLTRNRQLANILIKYLIVLGFFFIAKNIWIKQTQHMKLWGKAHSQASELLAI